MKTRADGSTLNGFLDRGSHFQGELTFEETFRIDGQFDGKIRSGSELILGDSAEVSGARHPAQDQGADLSALLVRKRQRDLRNRVGILLLQQGQLKPAAIGHGAGLVLRFRDLSEVVFGKNYNVFLFRGV